MELPHTDKVNDGESAKAVGESRNKLLDWFFDYMYVCISSSKGLLEWLEEGYGGVNQVMADSMRRILRQFQDGASFLREQSKKLLRKSHQEALELYT